MRPYQHPSERGFDFSPPATSRLASSRLIESASRCHFLGIGESSSSSSTVDSRAVADNAADLTNISSVNKSTVVADGSTLVTGSNLGLIAGSNVGANATVAGGDVISTVLDLAGAKIGDEIDNSVDLANAKIGSSEIGSITINDTGGDVLTQALDRVSEFAALSEASRQAAQQGLLSLAQQSVGASANTAAESTEKLSSLLDALADAKTQTDPEARKDNTLLWLVLGFLAYLWVRK